MCEEFVHSRQIVRCGARQEGRRPPLSRRAELLSTKLSREVSVCVYEFVCVCEHSFSRANGRTTPRPTNRRTSERESQRISLRFLKSIDCSPPDRRFLFVEALARYRPLRLSNSFGGDRVSRYDCSTSFVAADVKQLVDSSLPPRRLNQRTHTHEPTSEL